MKSSVKNIVLFLFLFIILFSTSGCSSLKDYIRGNPEENVFAYGFVQGNVNSPEWVDLIQVTPKDQHYTYACWTVNGVFIQGNLRKGAYQLGSFGNSMEPVDLGWSAPGFHLEKPGAYFLGSFKVISKGFINKEYSLEKIDAPDEAEVLKKAAFFAKGSRWEKILNERLKTLEENQ